MKKIISVFLSVLMLLSAVSGVNLTALAESGTCGDGVVWDYNADTKTLTVSGSGAMSDYIGADDTQPWKAHRAGISKLVISDGVTKIGNYAFTYLGNITELTIPQSVTAIGNQVFYMCTRLSKVTIAGPVSEIKGSTFSQCRELKEITLPATITKIGKNAFDKCLKLTDVYYGGNQSQWNAVSVNASGNDSLKNASIHCSVPCTHSFNGGVVTKPATCTENGVKTFTCTICGYSYTESINASGHTVVYDKKIAATYAKAGKTQGSHCSACGAVLTAQKSIAKLAVSKVTLSSVKSKKSKQISVKWKKNTKVSGYQIQYSTSKKFTKKTTKTVTVKSHKTTSYTIKKLKAKKKYYVRIRGYKTYKGKKYYSSYSKAKSVTAKR